MSESRPHRIGIIVVHGIGEQRPFEHLESVASNFYQALRRDRAGSAHVEVRHTHDPGTHTPVVVRWRAPDKRSMEAHFREVHWADLDEPATLGNWFKLVGWALAMPGVRRFSESWYETGAWPGMRLPRAVSSLESAWVRAQLFVISLLFLIMLVSVDVAYWLLRRLSFQPQWLKRVRAMIYDYLGDVKLYQDWFARRDETIEVHGERSRVAIRRRMVRALIQAATDVRAGHLDGYYIVAHSLGTVVAFNGLMEHGHVLANYLPSDVWAMLPVEFKVKTDKAIPARENPPRPPWLDSWDALNRPVLFAGLRGFLTLGSPLNKFATLWPALVPINDEPLGRTIPWINVADVQDLVAGHTTLYRHPDRPDEVGGLRVTDVEWVDQFTAATAHVRYCKANTHDRLVNRLIPWFEGGEFTPPPAQLPRPVAFLNFYISLAVLALFPLLLLAYLTWLARHSREIMSRMMTDTLVPSDGWSWFVNLWDLISGISFGSLYARSIDAVMICGGVVVACSLARYAWERWRFRPTRIGA